MQVYIFSQPLSRYFILVRSFLLVDNFSLFLSSLFSLGLFPLCSFGFQYCVARIFSLFQFCLFCQQIIFVCFFRMQDLSELPDNVKVRYHAVTLENFKSYSYTFLFQRLLSLTMRGSQTTICLSTDLWQLQQSWEKGLFVQTLQSRNATPFLGDS